MKQDTNIDATQTTEEHESEVKGDDSDHSLIKDDSDVSITSKLRNLSLLSISSNSLCTLRNCIPDGDQYKLRCWKCLSV